MTDGRAPAPEGFVVLGHIARPHGVHGAVVVAPYTDDPQIILDGRGLELLSPDGLTRRPVVLRQGKEAAQGLIVKLEKVATREAARALQGWRLGIPRELLPEADEDEVYWADLVGLELFSPKGEKLGRVAGLVEAGAGLLLSAARADGSGREFLVPFHEEFVVEVDLEAGRLIMDLPEGLLDL